MKKREDNANLKSISAPVSPTESSKLARGQLKATRFIQTMTARYFPSGDRSARARKRTRTNALAAAKQIAA